MPPSTPAANDDPLSPDERLRLQNELTISELESEHGAQFGFFDEGALSPEMEAEFLARVKAMEAGGSADYVSIGSLIDADAYEPFDSVAARYEAGDEAAGREAVEAFEALLLQAGVFSPQPEWLHDMAFYRYLTTDLLEHRIPAPPSECEGTVKEGGEVERHMIGVMYERLRQDGPEDLAAITEGFVIDLLSPDAPFSGELLADECRLGPEIGSREQVIAYVQAWKDRWTEIVPVGFALNQPMHGPDGALYSQFACKYEVVDKATGERTTHEGPGLVQVAVIDKRFQVVGCAMEGFEL